MPRDSGYPDILVAVSVVLNAAWAAFSLRHTIGAELGGNIDVMFSVYDLDSRYLRLPLAASAPFVAEEMGLFPVAQRAECRSMARTVCGGSYVQMTAWESLSELQSQVLFFVPWGFIARWGVPRTLFPFRELHGKPTLNEPGVNSHQVGSNSLAKDSLSK